MEVRRASTRSPDEKQWTVLIRRNTFGFPPTSADDFSMWEEAVEYVRKFDPITLRISLGVQSPDPAPSYMSIRHGCAEPPRAFIHTSERDLISLSRASSSHAGLPAGFHKLYTVAVRDTKLVRIFIANAKPQVSLSRWTQVPRRMDIGLEKLIGCSIHDPKLRMSSSSLRTTETVEDLLEI